MKALVGWTVVITPIVTLPVKTLIMFLLFVVGCWFSL